MRKTNLLTTVLFYIILVFVVLVFTRFTALSNWSELWNALAEPKVWLSLFFVLVFILGMQTVLQKYDSVMRELRRILDTLGLICWYSGMVLIIVLAFVPVNSVVQLSLTALGLAIIGIGTGFISLSISNKSQEKTTATANHVLYEKMSVIQQYIQDVSQPNSDAWDKAYTERIFFEIKAAEELRKIGDSEVTKMLDIQIQNLIDGIPQGERYKYLRKRLKEAKEGESVKTEIGTIPKDGKPSSGLFKLIKKYSVNTYKFCQNYIVGEYQKLSKIIIGLGLVILILVLNNLSLFNLSIHIEVNIGVPIAVLIIGYLPLLNPKRKGPKRSWKEIMTKQLDLLEILLLTFFVIMDSLALMTLFPGNYSQQNIIFFAGLLLSLVLLIKVIRYQYKG